MTRTAKSPLAVNRNAGTTNTTNKSLVKVVVSEDKGKWITPEKNSVHYIDEESIFPDVKFEIETTQAAPYEWKWEIKWEAKVSGIRESSKRGKLLKTFKESGTFKTNDKNWQVDLNGKVLGGILTVEVLAGTEKFKRKIYIKARNPSRGQIKEYSDSLDGTSGFDKILFHEAHGKNFINADGEPVVSFDKGYGITQMTTPAPTYQQCWSWKENIKGGSSIYISKRAIAKSYLKREGKGQYTEEQLQNETYSRYNGGAYYVWDATEKKLVPKDLICDPKVANIGWNSDIELNQELTAKELHDRDKDTYKLGKKGQSKDHPWVYTGVCYANAVNK